MIDRPLVRVGRKDLPLGTRAYGPEGRHADAVFDEVNRAVEEQRIRSTRMAARQGESRDSAAFRSG